MEIQLKIKSYHPAYIEKFCDNLKKNAIAFDAIKLPQKKEYFTVLRSPHVDKKARDQFERTTYNRLLVLQINYEINLLKIIAQVHKHIVGVNVELKIKKNV